MGLPTLLQNFPSLRLTNTIYLYYTILLSQYHEVFISKVSTHITLLLYTVNTSFDVGI